MPKSGRRSARKGSSHKPSGGGRLDESRASVLASLGQELLHPPSMKAFSRWAAAGIDRVSLLKHTIWGNIRWPKSIGRSLGPTLASGFTVAHWFDYINGVVVGPGVVEDQSKWVRGDAPSVWDVPDAGDEYVVSFQCYAAGFPNVIAVDFAEHQAWDNNSQVRLRSTARRIIGPDDEQPFMVDPDKHFVLSDFTIVEVPIRRF